MTEDIKEYFNRVLTAGAEIRWEKNVPTRKEVYALALDIAKVPVFDEVNALSCAKEAYSSIEQRQRRKLEEMS